MKKVLLLATLAGAWPALWPACGLAQTWDEIVSPRNTDNVLTHSMGLDRKNHSPLKLINKSNVKRLVPVWATSVMNDWGELAAPAVYNGVIYAINGKFTFALDVETGRQLWRTPVEVEAGVERHGLNRGAPVLYNGKLFRVTVDNHLIALDMKTGKQIWNNKFAEAKEGYYASGAPMIANSVLISGMSGGESTTRGFLDGWDPDTGKKLWRRYTIPAPGEPGSETWPQNSDAWTRGGGPTWRSGSYDPELDLVYWGTGNAEPYDPRPRGALDSLYTSSVLALRPKTGEIVCYYQYTHWPFQLGYFASSAARAPPIVTIIAVASARAPVELRYDMSSPPCIFSNRLAGRQHAASRSAEQNTPQALSMERRRDPSAREGHVLRAAFSSDRVQLGDDATSSQVGRSAQSFRGRYPWIESRS